MLVLNSGQVPWEIRRQIEVVFSSMVREINKKVPNVKIIMIIDQKNHIRRRSAGGNFQADKIIELFLIFGSRKERIDIKERLADEFTRLDLIEATGNDNFVNIFYESLDLLGQLDIQFYKNKYEPEDIEESEEKSRFKQGKDLFSSQPACIGFMLSIARYLFGRPGLDTDPNQQKERWNELNSHAKKLLARLEEMDNEKIGDFLDFTTLNEVISKGRIARKIGEFEREFFHKAFTVLIEDNFSLPNMTPCWRAY
jgi:hypothetical protein